MITDEKTVQRYAKHHAQMIGMLENLSEFVATMPAPDENGNVPGIDYCYIGDVARIHGALKHASDIAYELSE